MFGCLELKPNITCLSFFATEFRNREGLRNKNGEIIKHIFKYRYPSMLDILTSINVPNSWFWNNQLMDPHITNAENPRQGTHTYRTAPRRRELQRSPTKRGSSRKKGKNFTRSGFRGSGSIGHGNVSYSRRD